MRFALLYLLVACSSDHASQPASSPPPSPALVVAPVVKKPAPQPRWQVKHEVKLVFDGDPALATASCEFTLAPQYKDSTQLAEPLFEVRCKKQPFPDVAIEGATRIKRKDYDFGTSENAFSAGVLGRLTTVPLSAITEQANIKLALPAKVTFTFPGYEPVTVEPPSWWTSSMMFRPWYQGVAFAPTEPPDDGKLQALFLHEGWSKHELIGKGGKQLSDLDWIVIQRDNKNGKKKGCGYGLNVLFEATITIYDRRTGAVIEEHPMVNENPPCFDRGIHRQGSVEERSGIRHADVKKYIEAQIEARTTKP